jgi:uncharacterized membrane protein
MKQKDRSILARLLVLYAIDMIEANVEDEEVWTEEVIALLVRALEVASVKRKEKK